MSLRKQAFSGMVWTFGQQFSSQIITFGISVFLARLLLPSDFGTIALFGVVTSVASSIIDSGMTSSLIRTKDTDDSDLSTVFWFNFVASFVLYLIIFATAPLIADFYKVDILTSVIRVYCFSMIIKSFVAVQGVTFVKNMDFKTGFKIQIPSQIIGGLSGILFAYLGYGVWSLVFYNMIQTTVSTIQLWFYSKWKPSFIFSKAKLKEHFGFGYKLTLSGLLDTLFNNIYTIVIGKMFSPVQLGFYNRADTLKQLPVRNLSTALNKVTFPLFSRIKDDDVKLKLAYQKLMKAVVFIITPILCMMIVTAEPLIRFIYTEKWLPAAPYMQVLAISGILYPVHAYNLNILKVKGRTDLFLVLEVVKKMMIVIVLVFSLRYGIMGLIWGQVVGSFLAFFVNTHYTGKILHYGPLAQIADLLPTIVLCFSVSALCYYIRASFLTGYQDAIQLIVLIPAYCIFFLALVFVFKFKEIDDIKKLIKR